MQSNQRNLLLWEILVLSASFIFMSSSLYRFMVTSASFTMQKIFCIVASYIIVDNRYITYLENRWRSFIHEIR